MNLWPALTFSLGLAICSKANTVVLNKFLEDGRLTQVHRVILTLISLWISYTIIQQSVATLSPHFTRFQAFAYQIVCFNVISWLLPKLYRMIQEHLNKGTDAAARVDAEARVDNGKNVNEKVFPFAQGPAGHGLF